MCGLNGHQYATETCVDGHRESLNGANEVSRSKGTTMNGARNDLSLSPKVTKLFWWLSTLLFLLTETVVILSILKAHESRSTFYHFRLYTAPLMASLPWVVGMHGYSISKRRLSKIAGDQVESALLSRQFSSAVIAAFVTLSFFFTGFSK
jgi:hypothetical protein